ncbi:hypothetical protein TNCT_735161, partial [Trichonephila clavata]
MELLDSTLEERSLRTSDDLFCVIFATEHTHEGQKQPKARQPHLYRITDFLHEIFTKYGHDGQMTFE